MSNEMETAPLQRVFVVLDPTKMVQTALEKAEWVASRNNAVLHMYCCVDESRLDERMHASAVEQTRAWMDRVAERSRALGLRVHVEVESSSDWRRSIVLAAGESGSDLVVKSASPHGPLRRRLAKTADWSLLRECPCPVLMVSPNQPTNTKIVLAAVKLKPGDEMYTQLNEQVISLSHRVAAVLGADLHAVTVYRGDEIYFDRQRFADRCRLPRNRVHATEGAPYRGIAEIASQLNAGVVVVGCARDPDGTVLGSTAQRVIDEVESDVVVIPNGG